MKRLFMVGFSLFMLAAAACGPGPGEGRKSMEGYAIGEEIISALETYHTDNGEYPETLDDLVPDYIAAISVGEYLHEWRYTSDGLTYTLEFVYYGPGVNTCIWESGASDWICGGYF